MCPFVCLSLCLYVCLSLCLSVPISLSVCLSQSLCLYVCLSVPISLSVYLSVCLSVCLFVCASLCPFVCLYMHLSGNYLSILLQVTLEHALISLSFRHKLRVGHIDDRPASMLLISGLLNVQALFNYLLNSTTIIPVVGAHAGIPPTILSPRPFEGATLKCQRVSHSRYPSCLADVRYKRAVASLY